MPLVFHGNRAELFARLRELAAALSGRGPDPHDLARGILTRGAVSLLSQVQTAFLAKARGGVGSDGIQWQPLKRETIAARPTTPGERKTLGVGGKRVRGFLTPAEDKRWRKIFAQSMARLRARGVDEKEAMGISGRIAWAALKASGTKTRLDVLGGRTVEIGRDTGALFRSLTPGYEDTPSDADGQVFTAEPGKIVVGSNLPYAAAFHAKRPMWPEDGPPAEWFESVNAALIRGISSALSQILSAS